MDDFAPAPVYAYSPWPKGAPNHYALPAMGDANGWFYRRDWIEDPEIQAVYKEGTGNDLGEPKAQKDLKEIARFLQDREIDRRTLYGVSIVTERGSEGITICATSALCGWGFEYETEPGTYQMDGAVNSPEAVEALEFYKCCTPPGSIDSCMQQSLDAFKLGHVAMATNWLASQYSASWASPTRVSS